jgi:hypothetical protein
MPAGKTSVGYVLSLAVADQVYMGGAMVTDGVGLPLEFRYTEPVRATKLQRILYGDVLEKYIHGEVIAANLVSRLEQKPDLFLVSDPVLLSFLQASGRNSAALAPTRVPPLKEYGAEQDGAENDFLIQLSESGSPVRVRLAPDADGVQRSDIARSLTEVGRTMDPLEPLARVGAAVRMLWQEVPETPVE